ncbi:putative 2-Nitropropane dioxygenase [Epithele typhae]|uniref:putative 2-Nitropropane dioxygenase n=1 Tax=Epithele typhae TaxID=378194 RepID=UPI00200742D4|nr:putative 2-Nitropropane dioxygenase [Epithele typhae]KAH9917649.1 putative 2-Nitropropane dioxygenase [Epithele typhae]
MPLHTKLTQLLGSRSVVQGGMQWVGLPQLAAAVSNAEDWVTIPAALRDAIRDTRKMTSKPFGVNITLLPSINPPDYEGYARVAVEEGVRIFETAGNNPGPLIKFFKSQGCIVIHKCTTIRHAKSAERMGVDCLSIDGFECAGHPGEDDIGGLVLLARAAQELKIPYIASGGVADGRGLAAALALGACGVNMGTRFMCTVESPIHQNIKDKIVASSDRTRYTSSARSATPHASSRMRFRPRSCDRAPPRRCQVRGHPRPRSGQRGRRVYDTGDADAGIWSAGVVVGLIKDCPPCAELLQRIERDAEAAIEQMVALRAPKAKL